MDFDLSPDQVALRDAARGFLDEECPPARIRTVHASGAGWDPELWSAMVDLGWLGVAVDEDQGGLGLGTVESAVLLEQAGRHLVPVPLLPTLVALDVARACGANALVVALLAGRAACLAWSGAPGAVRAENGRLTGRPDPVPFASSADFAVVVAREDETDAVFMVELDESSRPAREPAMDLSRPIGWLHFDATPAQRLGGADAADRLL